MVPIERVEGKQTRAFLNKYGWNFVWVFMLLYYSSINALQKALKGLGPDVRPTLRVENLMREAKGELLHPAVFMELVEWFMKKRNRDDYAYNQWMLFQRDRADTTPEEFLKDFIRRAPEAGWESKPSFAELMKQYYFEEVQDFLSMGIAMPARFMHPLWIVSGSESFTTYETFIQGIGPIWVHLFGSTEDPRSEELFVRFLIDPQKLDADVVVNIFEFFKGEEVWKCREMCGPNIAFTAFFRDAGAILEKAPIVIPTKETISGFVPQPSVRQASEGFGAALLAFLSGKGLYLPTFGLADRWSGDTPKVP